MKHLELSHQDVLNFLPTRENHSHKGDYGKILLLCGSEGYTGAAALAAMGALRSGAGLVYLGVPRAIYMIEAIKLTEAIVFPLPDKCGMLSIDALGEINGKLERKNAVLIGPGLGISEGTRAVVEHVLQSYNGPVVVDADGINLISQHKDILRDRKAPTIITPHEGEFMRFCNCTIEGRKSAACKLAKELGIIVVLKGYETVITDGETCYINRTGNPGMAVGGSGDVLAGIITAFLGQGLDPLQGTACAVWLHGAAGDLCAKEIGQYGMLPTDVLEVLPLLMK